MNILEFQSRKQGPKLTVATCYDAWSAKLLNSTPLDALLVGDSVATVVHGYETTLHADLAMMSLHTQAVRRGAPDKLVIADMPFLSFRSGLAHALECAGALLRAGAQAVKLEGIRGHEDVVHALVESGIPVMGHLGLTPQSFHALGGNRVQARDVKEADLLLNDAKALQDLGCFGIVLECIPQELGQKVTSILNIPTIGIGAGPHTDGQVLVLQDLLGMSLGFKPKFLRTFGNGAELIQQAVQSFDRAVKSHSYPSPEESYNGESYKGESYGSH